MNGPKLRPSNLFRYDKCPGWWRVATPPEGASPEAEHGKMLHEVMARRIAGTLPECLALDGEDQRAVDLAMAEAADIMRPGAMMTEIPLRLDDMGMSGTADLVAMDGDTIHIVDWKFGRADTEEAQDNLQLAAYAIMAGIRWPDTQFVIVHIIQPFLRRHERYTHSRSTMAQAAQQIAEIRHRAETLTTLCPGSPQCDWCPAKAECPALRENMEALAKTTDDAVKLASPHLLAIYADAARLARKCADAIDAEVKRRLQSGETIPGYTLQSRHTKELASIGEAYKRLGIPADKFLGCCKASIPKLIDAFKDDNGIPERQARDFVAESLADIIEIKETVSIHREARQ